MTGGIFLSLLPDQHVYHGIPCKKYMIMDVITFFKGIVSVFAILPEVQELLGEIWALVVWSSYVMGTIVLLIGAVMWFSEYDPRRGKRLFVGGIIIIVIVWIIIG